MFIKIEHALHAFLGMSEKIRVSLGSCLIFLQFLALASNHLSNGMSAILSIG